MPTIETPLTELDAVNLMLRSIGEAPVNTLDSGTTVDVTTAQAILRDTSHETQEAGWKCNTERDYPLVPDINGAITLAANVVRVIQSNETARKYDLVQRGTTLYDRLNHTSVFPQGTIKAEVVFLLPFDQLPPVARRYFAIKAARKFQASVVGSDTLNQFTLRDEAEARALFEDAEGETTGYSIFDNYDVYRSLDRHSPGL